MTTDFGPPLKIGNPNWPVPGQPYQDGSPSWRRDVTSGLVRRKKPVGIDLLLQPTSYHKTKLFAVNSADVYRADPSIRAEPSYICTADKTWNQFTPFNVREAWGKVYKSAQNNRFNALTSLGELPETVKWFGQVSREMLNAYRYVKTGRWSKALDSWAKGRNRIFRFTRRNGSYYHRELAFDNRLASRYLEWRFAVSPLVNDVGDFLDALIDDSAKPNYAIVKGRSTGSMPITVFRTKGVRYFKIVASAVYKIDLDTETLQKWGGVNLLDTLWNLMPLSFMIDRFMPIGDYLSNIDRDMGITWYAKTTSLRENWQQVNDPPQNGSWLHQLCTLDGTSYIRVLGDAGGDSGTLPTDVRFPSDFWGTALDSLALARQFSNSFFK